MRMNNRIVPGTIAKSFSRACCAIALAVALTAPAAAQTDPSTPINLDPTGATVPDTAYPIPNTGVVFVARNGSDSNSGTLAAPFASITKAINSVPSGGTVVVRGGLYRDGYRNSAGTGYGVANKTLTVQAYPHEQVWFDGTDVVSNWTADGSGRWYVNWTTPDYCQNQYYELPYNQQRANNTGPCTHKDMYGDPANPAGGDPQMVFINRSASNSGYVHEVTSLDQLTPGDTSPSFHYALDTATKTGRIYIDVNPAGRTIEITKRPTFLVMGGAQTVDVKIRGIGLQRYASNEISNQTGAAVTIYGTNTLIENSVFREMAAQALYIGSAGGVVRHSVFANNGYNGTGSNGRSKTAGTPFDGLLIEANYYQRNNAEKFGTGCSLSCGQAAVKIAHMNGFTMRNNIVTETNGHGLWCDLGCSKGVFVSNMIALNTKGGVLYEVSDSGIIASNLLMSNGRVGTSGTPAIWVASANTKVYNNTIIDNQTRNGIWVYDDARYIGDPAGNVAGEVGPDTRNVSVANNIVAGSTEMANVKGDLTNGTNTVPSQFFSLYDYNAYHRKAGAGQILLRWVPPGTATNYYSPQTLAAALGLEAHGLDYPTANDPFFVDPAAGDYRVRTSSAAYHSGTTIPADVAAAIGITTTTGRSRGAIVWPGGGSTTP